MLETFPPLSNMSAFISEGLILFLFVDALRFLIVQFMNDWKKRKRTQEIRQLVIDDWAEWSDVMDRLAKDD